MIFSDQWCLKSPKHLQLFELLMSDFLASSWRDEAQDAGPTPSGCACGHQRQSMASNAPLAPRHGICQSQLMAQRDLHGKKNWNKFWNTHKKSILINSSSTLIRVQTFLPYLSYVSLMTAQNCGWGAGMTTSMCSGVVEVLHAFFKTSGLKNRKIMEGHLRYSKTMQKGNSNNSNYQ